MFIQKGARKSAENSVCVLSDGGDALPIMVPDIHWRNYLGTSEKPTWMGLSKEDADLHIVAEGSAAVWSLTEASVGAMVRLFTESVCWWRVSISS